MSSDSSVQCSHLTYRRGAYRHAKLKQGRYAPVSGTRPGRDGVTKDFHPPPPKRSRPEIYEEARRPPPKQVYNVTGRKTYAPVSGTKFVRGGYTKGRYAPVSGTRPGRDGVTKDFHPPPPKRSRPEIYEEARRPPPKQVYNVTESKPVNPVKVIEKKATLYAAAKETLPEPLPQRKIAPKQKTAPVLKPAAKPIEKEAPKKEAVKVPPVVKPKPAEAPVPVKQPVQKEVANKESVPKTNNTEIEDVPKSKPTGEPNADGLYELDSVTSSVLLDELQQIMIKVWQELPDSPATEPEEAVVDRFRNEAGDDLQNAMGLAVTSRLLNVHNPLYAKLHFSGKPEAGCLQAFIRDYKITAFKRIADSQRDVFAARFNRLQDFDKLCVHSEVKCGSATVSITPCYKYLSCPPSLKSIYADNIAKTQKRAPNSGPLKNIKDISESAVVKTNAKALDKKLVTEKPKSKTQTNTKVISAEPKKVTPKKVTPQKEKKNDLVNKDNGKMGCIEDMMVVDEEIGEEDDEEMNDQDILALMSGGIVLDECSGSDEEK